MLAGQEIVDDIVDTPLKFNIDTNNYPKHDVIVETFSSQGPFFCGWNLFVRCPFFWGEGGGSPFPCRQTPLRSLFCHSPDPPRGDPPLGAGAAVAASPGARRRRGDVAARRSMDSAVGLGKVWKGDLDDDICWWQPEILAFTQLRER